MNDIIEWNKRIRKDNTDFVAFFNRGITYYEMGEYEKALEDFYELLRIDPYNDNNEVYYYLGAISEKKISNN